MRVGAECVVYILNAHFSLTSHVGRNPRFSPPVSVENICLDGFSFTGSLNNQKSLAPKISPLLLEGQVTAEILG
jgi:hypothetical protein